MKLHWVELENWRQHTRTRIDFDDGATIIYGPNETGKSTILEALSRGLFDKSGSHAEAIRRIKPLTASGNVSSTVRFEFTLDETRYRVEKNFNLRRGTSLYKLKARKPTLLDQDDSADEKLIRLLEADLPSTRGSKPAQWGAFQWLWAPQDYRELPTKEEGDPTKSLHLEAKDGKGILVTPKFQVVQQSVQALYAQYFTEKGRPRDSSTVRGTEREIQELREKSSNLKDKMKNVDDEKERLEELERQLPTLEKRKMETKEELEKARSEAIDFSSIEARLEASEVAVKQGERDVRDAEDALKELKNSAKEIENLQNKEKEARENFFRLEALCEQLDKGLQEKVGEVEEKAMKIRECEELTRDARILWTRSDAMKKADELSKRLRRVRDIDKRIEILRKEEKPIYPSNKEVEKFIRSQTQIEALKENLKARGLAVNIAPGEKGSLEVEVDGTRIQHGTVSAIGTRSVSIGAPSLGKVTVEARLEQAHDAKVDIELLEKGIEGALRKYAVNSLRELKELSRAQKEIRHKIKELDAERRGIDQRHANEITFELRKLKEEYEQYEEIERTPIAIKLNPTDVDLGRLISRREKEEDETRTALDKARVERDKANKELTEKKEELAGARADHKRFSDELDNARTREREIIRQYGSIENQEKMLATANANYDTRRTEHENAKQRYEELEKGPINRIKRLEKQTENQELVIQQQRTSRDELKGGISTASLGGSYSELAETDSRIEILGERLEKEQIRAESCGLLKETLEQQYRSALAAVVGPIQGEVKRSLSYVTGFLHEDVELNEYLFPTRLGERGFENILLEFNDASSGLKEVLALCVRLAVAKHLSGRDSQCLVLDDPFVHVSSDRSNKMIELIDDAIREYELQVIVFTHRPMEFAGLTGKMVDIQSL